MARYGDLDELKLKVQRYMIPNDGSGLVSIEQAERWFLKLLGEAPTADVSPKSEWISVDERLPESDGKYLVCTRGKKVFIARFYGGVFCCFSDESRVVTHWMQLPEPPKM